VACSIKLARLALTSFRHEDDKVPAASPLPREFLLVPRHTDAQRSGCHALLDQRKGLELVEELGEVSGIAVDFEHVGAQLVHEGDHTGPKDGAVLLDEEGLERVADLVAHVGEGQVEAGHDITLELVDGVRSLARPERVSDQQVHKNDVDRIHEGDLLPALEKNVD